jgi:L-aspartate oxidase
LASESNPRFLISEVVRGEGAYLVDGKGHRFMVGRHPLAELAPRDLVCQSVVEVMRREKTDRVHLDARHIPADRLESRFPAISAYCLEQGLDMSTDLIPVSPAAHYLIGGVKTDLHGRTSLKRLYAGGEVASTGVHGANRLASNSLLEGVVFSRRIGELLLKTVESGLAENINFITSAPARPKGGPLDSVRDQLRRLMGEKVGVVRTVDGLHEAAKQLAEWRELLAYEYETPRDWETVNMLTMAGLIVNAALARRQSLGVHLVAG